MGTGSLAGNVCAIADHYQQARPSCESHDLPVSAASFTPSYMFVLPGLKA